MKEGTKVEVLAEAKKQGLSVVSFDEINKKVQFPVYDHRTGTHYFQKSFDCTSQKI